MQFHAHDSKRWALVGMAHDNYTNNYNFNYNAYQEARVRNLLQFMYNKVCRLYRLTEWSWANIPKDDEYLNIYCTLISWTNTVYNRAMSCCKVTILPYQVVSAVLNGTIRSKNQPKSALTVCTTLLP